MKNAAANVTRHPQNAAANVTRQKKFAANGDSPRQMSPVTRKTPRRMSGVENFFAIERARRAAGLSVARLCALAGVDRGTYARLRAGQTSAAHAATIRKLSRALAELEQAPARLMTAFIRGTTALLAQLAGDDPVAIASHDFSVQRPTNKQWLAAARLRRLAIHIATVELDMPRVALARALNCKRQSVHEALAWVNEASEDPAIAELLAKATQLVTERRNAA
jgi:transcriptional regulator with XRE-family HTH domain